MDAVAGDALSSFSIFVLLVDLAMHYQASHIVSISAMVPCSHEALPIVVDNARPPVVSHTICHCESSGIPALRPYASFRYNRITKHPKASANRWESGPPSPSTGSQDTTLQNMRTTETDPCRIPLRRRSSMPPPLHPQYLELPPNLYVDLDSAPRQPKRSTSPYYHRPRKQAHEEIIPDQEPLASLHVS